MNGGSYVNKTAQRCNKSAFSARLRQKSSTFAYSKQHSKIMIDIFICVLLLWAAFSGWRAGFIKEVVSTVGFLVGLLIAATCYSAFSEFLAVKGTETNMLTSVIAFFLLWIIVPILLGLVANLLTKALKGMQLGIPNSILGATVSVLKYVVLLSCVLNVMQALHIMNDEKTADSHLFKPVAGALQMFFAADSFKTAPADSVEAQPDTIWVDVSKK